ncbi:maleate cis-trans isomerase family protein [Amaricoccus tamworthensis]|uniref:maleate cis-trans isomerase family protein n=1 Tax=Amaricoccus tamworthensis TaxID=57002 RepID=UPI003C7C8456
MASAVKLFPSGVRFDVVGYGCTSGSAVIGADRVAELVRAGCETRHVTNPLSALVAACRTQEIKSLSILSPYVEPVSEHLRRVLADEGIETPVFGSFNIGVEGVVARITDRSIVEAAMALDRGPETDAIFLSCTNLQTLDVIPRLEQALGKPVLSSNAVLAWHMKSLAGLCPLS